MDHLLCALFVDKPRAAAAINALVNGGVGDQVASVVMHEGHVTHEDLGVAAGRSGLRMAHGAVLGALVGGLVGGGLGLVFAPAGVLLSALLPSVLFGGAAGALYTTLAGAIAGRDSDEPRLEHLQRDFAAGNVLVTLEVRGPDAVRKEARNVLEQFGGHRISSDRIPATRARMGPSSA